MKKNEPDKTRDLVARAILERGPASAVELAEKLEITPAGIRRHLDSLVGDGILEAREPHASSGKDRGRGRPSKVFVMTDSGRERFEHSYDDLAISALRFIAAKNPNFIKEFAQNRADDLEKKIEKKIQDTWRWKSLRDWLRQVDDTFMEWCGSREEFFNFFIVTFNI